jgi:hypothetical protein
MFAHRKGLAVAILVGAACVRSRPDYVGAPVPSAEPVAGCYSLSWTSGYEGSYPDTICLLARGLTRSSVGVSPGQLALDRPLGEPTDANFRRWSGQWWWQLRGDSLFVVLSDGYSGYVLRGLTGAQRFAAVLEACGDVGPPFCKWVADAVGTRVRN